MKLFKASKKFKKVKLLKNTIRELEKENEHLRSEIRVQRQEVDRAIDLLTKVNE